MGKKKSNLKSTCCNAEIKVHTSSDEIDKEGCTNYYVCTKCHQPCNFYLKERKVWIRNPKTQIISNKKKKDWNKLSKQEIEDYRKHEDF